MESILSDLKFAVRQWRKSPAFSAIVVVILALGVGATTTIFSIVDAVMLRPLPYVHPERLVDASSREVDTGIASSVSYPDFSDWRDRNHSFSHLVAFNDKSFTLTGVERPLQLDSEIVSWDFLAMLGVRPELGRGFDAEDEVAGSHVVLISHSLWKSKFATDSNVVGRAIHLNGELFTIIGVMPRSFRFPVDAPQINIWTPTTISVAGEDIRNRGTHIYSVMGRLKEGVSTTQADMDLKSIATQLARDNPLTNGRFPSAVVRPEIEAVLGDTRGLLLIVFLAVTLVLFIACGNVANLYLARLRERQREIAIRAALGAGHSRVIRQLMVESLGLSLIAGLAGCGLAFAAVPAVLKLIGNEVPRAADAGVNLPVLGFAFLTSVSCAFVFGLGPSFTASRTNLVSTLQQSGQSATNSRDWLRKSIVIVQIALGVVLTVSAGLLVASFVRLMHVDEGFNPHHLLTYTFETPDTAYKDTRAQFYRRYFERLRALPGVQAAAGSIILPMTGSAVNISFENPEQPVASGSLPIAELTPISTGFFKTMQIPLLEGRDFTDGDDMGSPQVMIVNRALAKRFFHGQDPIGQHLRPYAGNGSHDPLPFRQIVGVVGNVRDSAGQREMNPVMYLPASQISVWCCLRTVVRTAVDPLSLESAVSHLVSSMDSTIPIVEVRTMDDLLSTQLSSPRFTAILFGSFAGLALILTILGIYGVMAYSVSRRTQEIGVRLALGAQRGDVIRMVLREAAVLISVGIAMGVAVSLASASILDSMLYGVQSRDPVVLLLVCTAVALTGLLAACLPSLRAASVDPMQALRSE